MQRDRPHPVIGRAPQHADGLQLHDDLAGHDAYQVHELHARFLERHASEWAKVRIYDQDG